MLRDGHAEASKGLVMFCFLSWAVDTRVFNLLFFNMLDFHFLYSFV